MDEDQLAQVRKDEEDRVKADDDEDPVGKEDDKVRLRDEGSLVPEGSPPGRTGRTFAAQTGCVYHRRNVCV